ncbi:MAG: LuxR C-terminal-related transcriptional regulator [Cocleimonas sp.]
MTQLQKIALGIFFLVLSAFSLLEVINELAEIQKNKENINQASFEIILVILSFGGMIYFTYLFFKQGKHQRELETNLKQVREQLESSNVRLRDGKKEYQEVIQWQFNEWALSPSEKEVALLMLKGLSIKEVSQARSTQEKTVRKQASAIYEKSGLGGRHELSAWFFEDLL